MQNYLFFTAGLVLLFFGGESTLRGALHISKKLNLSKILVSAVIIGFGTSLPELTVSVQSVLEGKTDIALGNVVGSNIVNLTLIFGVSIMISPLLKLPDAKRDILFMLIITLCFILLKIINFLNFFTGIGFLLALAIYIYVSYQYDQDKKETVAHIEEDHSIKNPYPIYISLPICALGIGLLVLGGSLLVDSAVNIAREFNISEAVIGLTIIAIGTGLPELATCVVAAMRKHNDVIVGNLVGSNIFNILGILGVTLIVDQIPVTDEIMNYGVWEMLFITIIFTLLFFLSKQITKFQGFIMLLFFIIYNQLLFL